MKIHMPFTYTQTPGHIGTYLIASKVHMHPKKASEGVGRDPFENFVYLEYKVH